MNKWKSTLLATGAVVIGTSLIPPIINPVDAGPGERYQTHDGDRGKNRDHKETGDRKERRDRKEAYERKARKDRKEAYERKERKDRKEAGGKRKDDRKRFQERDRREGWGAAEYKKKRRDWKRRKRSEAEFNIFLRETRRYRGPEWRRERYWKRYRANPIWYILNPYWYQYEDPDVCDWIFNVAADTGSRKWQLMYWDCVDFYE